MDTIEASGSWLYRGTLYRDRLIRVTVDSDRPDEAYTFFRDFKEVLKARFEQVDIWITAHDVDLI